MSVHIDPAKIVWDTFGGLEPPQPEWREQFAYWEDYNEKFFGSNGMTYDPADSNVEPWLMAEDRAPFADMIGELLPRLRGRVDLDQTDAILMAHWLPDLHLGTSVTNFAMHKLGLENCFGIAISDRGLSAPFFAFDALVRYLQAGRQRGLLLIADQKHVMYRSDVIDALDPLNSACIVPVDLKSDMGARYAGYARVDADADNPVAALCDQLGLDPQETTAIGAPDALAGLPAGMDTRIADNRLVCSAVFAAYSAFAESGGGAAILLCRDDRHVTALGFGAAR